MVAFAFIGWALVFITFKITAPIAVTPNIQPNIKHRSDAYAFSGLGPPIRSDANNRSDG